jgi:hypothetical protein
MTKLYFAFMAEAHETLPDGCSRLEGGFWVFFGAQQWAECGTKSLAIGANWNALVGLSGFRAERQKTIEE